MCLLNLRSFVASLKSVRPDTMSCTGSRWVYLPVCCKWSPSSNCRKTLNKITARYSKTQAAPKESFVVTTLDIIDRLNYAELSLDTRGQDG